MEILELFKRRLLEDKSTSSKSTLKNYLSDVRHFIFWFEKSIHSQFEPNKISSDTLLLYEKTLGGIIENGNIQTSTQLSIASMKRHLSSLRKFFSILEKSNQITINPFTQIQPEITSEPTDLWHLKSFKDYLQLQRASKITVKNYISDIAGFARWYEETILPGLEKPLSSTGGFYLITQEILEDYRKRLLEIQNAAPRTINRKLSALRKYLNFATEKGFINANELTIDPVKLYEEQQNLIDEGSIELSDLPKVTPKPKTYSIFPPIRLLQKLIIYPYIALEERMANSIASIIAGKPLSGVEKLSPKLTKILEAKKTLRSNTNSVSNLLGIRNVSKEFYAPDKVSLLGTPLYKRAIYHLRYTRPNWYKKYHNYSFVHYVHFALLVIFASGVGVALYQNLVAKKQAPTFAAATAPPRIISFQGRLTDNLDNPITSTSALRFAIYNDATASGGALLWQEAITNIVPDQDGIFSILLGGGTQIPSTVFTDNSQIYLGVTVGTTPELTPRQRIASVGYATNAEFLQGQPPTTQAGITSFTNVILALDSSGNLTLADSGSTDHTFQVSNGAFNLKGQTLYLTTNTGSEGNVILSPDGLGKIDIQRPIINTTTMGNIVPGGVEVNDKFGILATESAVAAFIINNNTSGGDILAASSSGITRFKIANDGTITDGVYSTAGGIFYGSNSSGTFAQTTAGSLGQCLQSTAGGAPIWGNCGGSDWRINLGALSPNNDTLDLLVGGITTSSAKFRFINVNSGTPVASVSANIGNNATFISGDGTLGTTNRQTLTIGNSSTYDTTGNLLFNPNGVGKIGIGTTSPLIGFDLRGNSGITPAASISANTSYATLLVDNSGTGDLIAASASGVPNFVVKNNGDLIVGQDGGGKITVSVIDPYLVQNQKTTGIQSLTFQTMGSTNADFIFKNTSTTLSTLTQAGQLQLPIIGSTGGIVIGGDTQIFRGAADRLDVASGDSFNLVSGNLQIGGTTVIDSSRNGTFQNLNITGGCTGCTVGAPSPFQELTGAIVPLNGTLDFLVGSQASTSAKFAVLNIGNGGTPTASVSAVSNGTGLSIGGDGTLQGTLNNNIVIGGNTTGAIQFKPNNNSANMFLSGANVAIGNQNPQASLDVSQNSHLSAPVDKIIFGSIGNTIGVLGYDGSSADEIRIGAKSNVGLELLTNDTIQAYITNTGNFGIGTTFPTAKLDVNGTASVSGVFKLYGTPTIQSTSNQTLTLGGDTTGDIQFKPGNASSPSLYLQTGGNVGIGTTSPTAPLHVNAGSFGGNAAFIVNQTGVSTNDIFAASSSGTTKFVIQNDGTASSSAGFTIDGLGSLQSTNNQTLTIGGGSTGSIVLSPNNGVGTIRFTNFTTNGGILYTNATGVLAQTGAGSALQCLLGNLTWGTCATGTTTSPFYEANGAIVPLNGTLDFLVGSQATTSAKFAVLNIGNGDTPIASVSSGLNGTAAYFDANGNFRTANKMPLTLGGGNTGNITIQGNNTLYLIDQAISLNAVNPTISAGGSYTLTLNNNSTGNIQFFSSSNTITSAGELTIAGSATINGGTVQLANGSQGTIQTASNADIVITAGLGTINLNTVNNGPVLTGSGLTTLGGGLTVNGATTTFGNAAPTITTGTNTDLTITPNGTGNLILSSDFNTGVKIGTSSNPPAILSISGGIGSNAGFILNRVGATDDIFAASSSGTTKFVIKNDGTASTSGNLVLDGTGNLQTTKNQTLTIGGTSTGNIVLSPNNGSGNIRFSNFSTNNGLLYTNGSGVLSQTGVGGALQCLLGDLTWGSCGTGTSRTPYQELLGAIVPNNTTEDFLAGGQASTSAAFKVTGQGNPFAGTLVGASISANTSFVGLLTDNKGVGDLFAASSSGVTQFVIRNNGAVGIGTNIPGAMLDVNGNLLLGANSTIDARASGTITIGNGTNTTGLTLGKAGTTTTFNATSWTATPTISGLVTGTLGFSVAAGQSYTGAGTVTLSSASNNDLTVTAQGSGNTIITSDFDTGVRIGASTNTPAALSVSGGIGSNAGFILNRVGTTDDIFAASSSGTTKFVIKNDGTASSSAGFIVNGAGNIQSTNNQTLTIGGSSTGFININSNSGQINLFNNTNINGNLTGLTGLTLASGAITLGGTTGSSTQCLLGGASASWGSCGTGGFGSPFRELSGAIVQLNSTEDFLAGGQASTSATFKVTGQGNPFAGTQVGASVSANTSFAALLVDNKGVGDLFAASSSGVTQFQIKNNGAVGIGAVAANRPTAMLDVAGAASIAGTLSFRNGAGTVTTTGNNTLTLGGGATGNVIINPFGGAQFGIGTQTPLASIDLRAAMQSLGGGTQAIASISGRTSFAGLIVDNSGLGDLFTASSSGLTRFVIGQGGNVGIGTSQPSQLLTMAGGNFLQTASTTPTVKGSVQDNTNLLGAQNLYVNGRYAYVTASSSARLTIVDIANPSSPAVISSLRDTTNLLGAYGIAVVGQYAYVTASSAARLTIVNISHPTAPIVKGSVQDTGRLAQGGMLAVEGGFAYVPASASARLTVVDVSNANAPVVVSSLNDSVNLNGATGVVIQGKYAYVTSSASSRVAVVDISNPYAPFLAGSIVDTTRLNGATGIYVSGRYAYVTSKNNNRLTIIDVSTPNAPTIVGSINDSTNLVKPTNVQVAGNYAYVTSTFSNRLTVVDVTTASAPTVITNLNDNTNLNNPFGLYVAGKYAYVTSFYGNRLTVVDINGIDVPTANIGNLASNSITVHDNVDIGQSLFVKSAINVGNGGIYSQGNLTIDVASGGANLIQGAPIGRALLSLNYQGTDQNIFTASTAGVTKFAIGNDGQVMFGNLSADPTTAVGAGSVYYNTTSQALKFYNGSTWSTIGSGTTTSPFKEALGAIMQNQPTEDFLLGGNATTSAQFSVLGLNQGTNPTASISANTGANQGYGVVLGGDGSIQSLRRKTLTIGGSTTGDITLAPAGGTGGVTIGNLGTKVLAFYNTGVGLDINWDASYDLYLGYNKNAGDDVIIGGGGNGTRLGIGTTAGPNASLHVNGGNWGGNAAAIINQNGNSANDIFAASSSGVTKFVISNTGNVGIGTVNAPLNTYMPDPKFQIYSTLGTSPAASISARSTAAPVLLVTTDDGANGDLFVASVSGQPKFRIDSNGGIHNNGGISNDYGDFAEYYKKANPAEQFEAGQLVCIQGNGVVKCSNNSSSQRILGVISDRSFLRGNASHANDPNYVLVGMVGQLGIWANGDVKAGDPLTFSSTPGVATVAKSSNNIIGYAQEGNNGTLKRIESVIQPTYFNPNTALQDDSVYNTLTLGIRNGIYTVFDAFGNSINHIDAFSKAMIGSLQAGFASIQTLAVNTITATTSSLGNATASTFAVAANTITIGGQDIRQFIIDTVRNAGFSQGNIVSPIATDTVKTNVISPLANDSTIQLNANKDNFELKNTDTGKTVAWFNNQGNATISGQLTSDGIQTSNATISGTLASGLIETTDASVAGTLTAGTIIANNISGLDQKLATLAAALQNTNSASNSSQTINNYLASDTVHANFGIFEQGITSMGPITSNIITATDQLAVGNSFTITNNAINTVGTDLAIQSLRQGDIAFEGGLIKMDTDGNMLVSGNLNLLGEIDAVHGVFSGTLTAPALATGLISPLPGDDLAIKLSDSATTSGRLKILNNQNQEVLSINSHGDLNASGSGTFAKLNFNLVGKAEATSLTEAVATGSAGFATLRKGQVELTIKNPIITSKSLIYITPFGDTENKVIYLLRQVPQSEVDDGSFTVGISGTPSPKDIQFNWLIVN